MAQRLHVTLVRSFASVLPWVAVTLVALAIGVEAARSPERAIMLVGAIGIGWLALGRRLVVLVPVATLVLAWGTSTLPGVSIAFALKFGAIALIGATAVPYLVTSDRRHVPLPVAFGAGFFGLIFFALLSSVWSVAPSDTAQKAISLLLVWGAVAVAIPLWAKNTNDLERLLRATAVTSAIAVAIGLALGLSHVIAGFEGSGRFRGFLNSSNAVGYWLAPLLPALVIMAIHERRGRKRSSMMILVAMAVIAIAFSGSRGGSLAALAGIVAGVLASGSSWNLRHSRRGVVVLLAGFAIAMAFLPVLGFQLRTTSTSKEGFFELGTGSERATAWAEAIPVIGRRPLQGHGFGTTPIIFPALEDYVAHQGTLLGRTHDSYLEAGLDLGWVGMGWLVALSLSGAFAALRVARRPGPDQAFATALFAGIVGGIVESMFESGMLAAGGLLALPFWMVVAMAHVLLAKQAMEDRAAATSGVPSLLPTA